MDSANGRPVEHTQSHVYACVLECSRLLRQLVQLRQQGGQLEQLPADQQRLLGSVRGETVDDKIVRCWGNLQGLVDCICDSEMNKTAARRLRANNLKGVKQVGCGNAAVGWARVRFDCMMVRWLVWF